MKLKGEYPIRLICSNCKKMRKRFAERLCKSCFRELNYGHPHNIQCSKCGTISRLYGNGMCQACWTSEYRQAHKRQHALYEKERRKNKPEQIKKAEDKRKLTAQRIEWKQAYHQKWYAKNREKQLAYQSAYRRADPDRRNNYKSRRRARVAGLPDTLTLAQWHSIVAAHNHSCAYCGAKGVKLEREHKLPASRGGGYTAENIVPACSRCNRRKKDMTDAEFRRFMKQYP